MTFKEACRKANELIKMMSRKELEQLAFDKLVDYYLRSKK